MADTIIKPIESSAVHRICSGQVRGRLRAKGRATRHAWAVTAHVERRATCVYGS